MMRSSFEKKPLIIGIMGTTGSGKSVVSRILQSMGGYIVDADKISRTLLSEGTPETRAIRDAFGDGIMQSDAAKIDRKKLAQRIFGDDDARRKLNSIMFPIIKREMYAQAATAYNEGYEVIVFDAPLLVESGLHEELEHIWLVISDDETRIARITVRDGITRDEAKARIAARVCDAELAKYATAIIENNESYEELQKRVKSEYEACLSYMRVRE